MTSNNPEISDKEDLSKAANKSDSSELPQSDPPSRSATTKDNPSFGWSGYAERVNGRFAMVGFIAILLIEALSKSSFLHWAGFLR